jgi:acetyltransferase
MYARAGLFIGYSFRICGKLDIECLSRAFAALRQKYPVLAAHLERVDGSYIITKPDSPLPEVVVRHGNVESPLAGVDVAPDRVLSALQVVHDGDQAAATLLIARCIADGRHGVALLVDLWNIYTAIAAGARIDIAPHPYPEPLEKLIADRCFRESDSEQSSDAQVRLDSTTSGSIDHFADSEPKAFTFPSTRLVLSEEKTRALIQYGHRYNTTIHAMVSAAIVQAEADAKNVPITNISYEYSIDLRKRIEPPIADTAGTNVLGFTNFKASSDTFSITELAHEIRRDLDAGLEDGSILQAGLRRGRETPGGASTRTSLTCTNVGRVPAPLLPEGVQLEAFQGFFHTVSQNSAPTNPPNIYVISTFQKKLSVSIQILDPANVEKKVAAVESYLCALT